MKAARLLLLLALHRPYIGEKLEQRNGIRLPEGECAGVEKKEKKFKKIIGGQEAGFGTVR